MPRGAVRRARSSVPRTSTRSRGREPMPKAGDIYYRETGAGEPPIVVLHGGWGYEFYPFDDAIAGVPRRFVIPDRTGYGKSAARPQLPADFHALYAHETERFLEELSIGRCVLWGHSDGAVIA